MAYIYKNEVDRPINIGGYQFAVGGELPSNIIIEGFKEAVSNKFLSLKKVKEVVKKVPDNDQEEEAKKLAEAEALRKAEEERLAAEEAAKKAEEEAQKLAEAEAAKKLEEEEAKKLAEAEAANAVKK